jgi:hypothetical protein
MRKWAQNVRRYRIEYAAEIPAQVHSLADESEPAKKLSIHCYGNFLHEATRQGRMRNFFPAANVVP